MLPASIREKYPSYRYSYTPIGEDNMPPPPTPSDWPSFRRWLWHRCFHHCCTFHRPPHLRDHPVDWAGFLAIFAIKFILEVCGAAGAVWGFSEVIHWRQPGDEAFFQALALLTFVIFLVRFYWHAKHWLEHEHDFPFVKIHHRRQHVIHFGQVFAAKLLLQVCGAAGAVWGASEVMTFRTADNKEAWRQAAIITGNIFFLRWVVEIMSYCLVFQRCHTLQQSMQDDDEEGKHKRIPLSSYDRLLICVMQLNDWNQSITVKFILEVCGAAGAVWGFSEIVEWRHEGNSDTVWRPLAMAVGAIFALRYLWDNMHFLFKKEHHQHLVTEPLSVQKRTSVALAHPDLHVSTSVRRLSMATMRKSMKALGLSKSNLNDMKDLDVPSNEFMERDDEDDDEENNRGNKDNKPSKNNVQAGTDADDLEMAEGLQIASSSETKESYQSCDSSAQK